MSLITLELQMMTGMYRILKGLNKGLVRLMIVGYLICIGLVVVMNMQKVPKYEQNPAFDTPFFADANRSHRLIVQEVAEEMRDSRRYKTYALLVGYPIALFLGVWIYAGFKSPEAE